MRKILFLFFAWIMALSTYASGNGDWTHYLSYTNALSNIAVGNDVYANFGGNLLSYHTTDGEVRLFSKQNGLHGQNIVSMGYSPTEKCLVLVYSDLMIDLYYPEEDLILPISQFKNSGMDGLKLNHLFVDEENALLSFNMGMAHLDLNQQNVIGFYPFDEEVKAAAYYQEKLFVSTPTQLLVCPVDGNPLDHNEWQYAASASFSNFVRCDTELFCMADKAVQGGVSAGFKLMDIKIDEKEKKEIYTFKHLSNAIFQNIATYQRKLIVADPNRLLVYNMENPTMPEQRLNHKNQWYGMSIADENTIWASNGMQGLQAYEISGDSLKAKGEAIGNYGPRRDLCYFMKYFGKKLLIAGGRLDPMDRLHYPGVIMEYADGQWKHFQDTGVSEQTGVPFRDITSVAVDPKNENHVFASAGGTGLYEFEDYKFKSHMSNRNSPLVSAAGNFGTYVRVDGLNFDEKGNLWMVNNSQQDTILRVRRPDGTWKGYFIEGLMYAPTCEKTLIDRKGRLWVASRRTVDKHRGGLLCLDYNGTVDNTKDDVSTYRTNFINQDGKSYSIEGVYCMAEDKNGAIWVGTRVGLFVISDPDNWHASNFNVIQVKVPRNDGTNLADYLLADMMITAITVDGADRKWIAVEGGGLYLVSPDGTKVIANFNESNSPILSNNIYSLAANLETGEIMIGTDRGICSYQSSATMSETSLDKNKIKVFPNPVRPEFHGNLTVTGLTDNAEVKVVTANGEAVAVGTSTGGTFIWNVKGGDGARVAAGVYYLMIATSDGEEGIAAKFVVI